MLDMTNTEKIIPLTSTSTLCGLLPPLGEPAPAGGVTLPLSVSLRLPATGAPVLRFTSSARPGALEYTVAPRGARASDRVPAAGGLWIEGVRAAVVEARKAAYIAARDDAFAARDAYETAQRDAELVAKGQIANEVRAIEMTMGIDPGYSANSPEQRIELEAATAEISSRAWAEYHATIAAPAAAYEAARVARDEAMGLCSDLPPPDDGRPEPTAWQLARDGAL